MSLTGPENLAFGLQASDEAASLGLPPWSPEDYPYQQRVAAGFDEGVVPEPFWQKAAMASAIRMPMHFGELDEQTILDDQLAQQWLDAQGLTDYRTVNQLRREYRSKLLWEIDALIPPGFGLPTGTVTLSPVLQAMIDDVYRRVVVLDEEDTPF